jgi:transcription initiation factor TFIIH subunit 3
MNQKNAIALIAAHNTKADYLYPNRVNLLDKYASPWDNYEQISDIDEKIKENLTRLTNDQLQSLQDANNKDNLLNDSMISSALALALCYINRIQQKYTFADTVNYRILILKGTDDSSNQYMNFMNMIFTAEKLNVIIDSCSILQDSSLLQQASNLTTGFYFKVDKIYGLLNYLLWLFLPDVNTRKMLIYPPKTDVDYRAACFCHRKLIDVGYVCSVCLSVFCSFTPICSTCNCNFQFDINMLKKASSLKQGKLQKQHLQKQQQQQQQQQQGLQPPSLQSNLDPNRLANQFNSTSLSSPANMLMNENSSDFQTAFDMDQYPQPQSNQSALGSARIITAGSVVSRPASNRNEDLNDSLDMLE